MLLARNTLVTQAACAIALLVASPAAAQESPPGQPAGDAPPAQAETPSRPGETLSPPANPEEAYAAYRAAWEQRHDGRTAARLGEIELLLGKHVDAVTHLRFALRAYPEEASPEERARLAERLAEAERSIAELRIHASARFAEVWIDGARAGLAASGPVIVTPGTHAVEIRSPGYLAQRLSVDVPAGSARDLTVALTRASAASPDDDGPLPPRPPRHEKETTFIAGGLASATMLTLLGSSLIARGDKELRILGTGTVILAGALAVGVGLYAIWPAPQPASQGAPAASVSLVPAAGPGGGGLAAIGRF